MKKFFTGAKKRSFLYISTVIFLLDITFVCINYITSKQALNLSLLNEGFQHQQEFSMTIEMVYRSMMQIGLFVSNDQDLNTLFLKGKKAVEIEGGGKGGIKASEARSALLKKIKPTWDKMTSTFNLRQLHYHLAPGSLSFLRVHSPNKYGDRLDDIRHMIVDTNHDKKPRFGLETGRIYSGLRAVYPVWANGPSTNQKVFVGAVEVGTSMDQILPAFAKQFNLNAAVLFTKKHVESKMWPDFIKKYFKNNPSAKYYLESTSSTNIKKLLPLIKINHTLQSKIVDAFKFNNKYIGVYYHPVIDYQSIRDKSYEPAGLVIFWWDITQQLDEFHDSVLINIVFALIAFFIVEIVLLWFFAKEGQLKAAKKDALIDGLTKINNRRYLELFFLNQAKDKRRILGENSIIICDIDYFKLYNDHYGHQAGDMCLTKVAQGIQSTLKRKTDILCRYGGEEFVVLLPNTNKETALAIANKINQTVLALKIPHQKSQVAKFVSLSLGVATVKNGVINEALLKEADKNLYTAKSSGRNRVCG